MRSLVFEETGFMSCKTFSKLRSNVVNDSFYGNSWYCRSRKIRPLEPGRHRRPLLSLHFSKCTKRQIRESLCAKTGALTRETECKHDGYKDFYNIVDQGHVIRHPTTLQEFSFRVEALALQPRGEGQRASIGDFE